MLHFFFEELSGGLPDGHELARVAVRLIAAAVLGGVLGLQREMAHKPAGMRTHMLVSLGAAVFVLVPLEMGAERQDLSRVIQGIAAGVGFLGAGAILKLTAERSVQGLTTAAVIWLTAAVGVAVGVGGLGIAIVAVSIAWVILAVLVRVEPKGGQE